MAKLRRLADGRIVFICPGCDQEHVFTDSWSIVGDWNAPTISPSIKVTMGPKADPITHLASKGSPKQICHSFIKNGNIQFLSDCTHSLAEQTVELPEIKGA